MREVVASVHWLCFSGWCWTHTFIAILVYSTEGLGGLTQLRTLRASNNVLTELPDSLAQLQVGVLAGGGVCLCVVCVGMRGMYGELGGT
jgi:hypothetical protein